MLLLKKHSNLKLLFHIFIFVLLTLITQIGGLVYLISILLIKQTVNKSLIKRLGVFIALYLFATSFIVPAIAPIFGREKIKETQFLEAQSIFYKLANRNYVKPELNIALNQIATEFEKENKGIKMVYLDANFPFIDKFPLFPHLSHHDGKKIDVSFIYKNPDGQLTNKKPSVSGYGVYENPKPNEYDQCALCKKSGNRLYDFSKYLTFGTTHKDIKFSENATRSLANFILRKPAIGKMFIEPHLKTRLNLTSNKVRFQGCQSVRHDDHIHFQLK